MSTYANLALGIQHLFPIHLGRIPKAQWIARASAAPALEVLNLLIRGFQIICFVIQAEI